MVIISVRRIKQLLFSQLLFVTTYPRCIRYMHDPPWSTIKPSLRCFGVFVYSCSNYTNTLLMHACGPIRFYKNFWWPKRILIVHFFCSYNTSKILFSIYFTLFIRNCEMLLFWWTDIRSKDSRSTDSRSKTVGRTDIRSNGH